MTEQTTPKDITPMKRKGLDIAVKGLSKSYPFIIGYKDDTTTQYDSIQYIDLIVDLKKLSEYMDKPINPYWEREVQMSNEYEKVYAIWSYLKFSDEEEINYKDNVRDHPGYILGKDIGDLLNTIYEYIPEEYKLYYEFTSEYSNTTKTYPVLIRINSYLMTIPSPS